MQRIINNSEQVVEDSLIGYVKAHSNLLAHTQNPRVLRYAGLVNEHKVGVITGGGSGHEPAFLGYVGYNMLDAVAIGEIFSSPTANSFLDAAKVADKGRGVACLYGNYAGDNMNVRIACKMAKAQGLTIKTVVANDDIASASSDQLDKRRGVAGEIFMWKVGAASATRGDNLEQVIELAQRTMNNTRSIGIGLSPCTIPAVGKANFHIPDGKMEVGIGHHGEPGIKTSKLMSANAMAETMVSYIMPDLPFASGDNIAVLVSGLGATPNNELHILYAHIADLLENHGLNIHHRYVGNYFTSLEMAGATLTVMKLDNELSTLMDVPVISLGLTQP
ncbi:MAG: dihydroxyacetone kinase subunit DhaK [Ostreibacterium sp.]